MAPIRRYLRISKYSVLEARIYLDNPALAQSWLLNPRDPVLPRVVESVRPLVLPKLREEQDRERSRKKGKLRSIKDVVIEGLNITSRDQKTRTKPFADEFEVSIFLTQTETRHSLLYKQKIFRDKTQTKLKSNSSRLTGGDSLEAPIDVDNATFASEQEVDNVPVLREEDDDDQEPINLDEIPDIHEADQDSSTGRPKRRRQASDVTGQGVEPGRGSSHDDDESSDNEGRAFQTIDTDSSDDELFVGDGGHDEEVGPPPPKRRKEEDPNRDAKDDKKKLAMDISYEGFAIYGRVLCLVVKRRDGWGARSGNAAALSAGARSQAGRPGGQAMMENWITSTQLPAAEAVEDETT
jgi:hypothetical protein